MGSISHHITPLVNNSIGGGHTHTTTHTPHPHAHTHPCPHTHAHTHTHTHTQTSSQNNVKKPGIYQPAAGAHLVKNLDFQNCIIMSGFAD